MAKEKLGTNAGQYYTDLGKLDTGKQPRLYMGRVDEISEDTARLRRARLREFWDRCQTRQRKDDERGIWRDDELGWARQIAKGATSIQYAADDVPRSSDALFVRALALKILNEHFDGIVRFILPPNLAGFVTEISTAAQKCEDATSEEPNGERLHKWLDAFATYCFGSMLEINEETKQHEPTEWAKVFSDSVRRIKRWTDDIPLSKFDYAHLEQLVLRIANRPIRKETGKPIKVKYAKHALKALRRFVRWLPKRTSWRKPDEWEEIFEQHRPKATNEEKSKSPIGKVKTYSLEQLGIIYRYATPFERCLFLLAINCGFGAAEISSLRSREIDLDPSGHSYIKRVRLKTETGVYGEHWLFPETVEGLQWAFSRAARLKGPINPEYFVILRKNGKTLVIKTKAGNRSNKAANAWTRLTARIISDHPDFPKLSFGKLRKTAGNLIKDHSDGETVAVFHQRSSAVATDDEAEAYTDRLFDRVHAARRKVYEQLRPAFSAITEPFPEYTTKTYIGRKKTEKIQQLWAEGQSPDEIVRAVGVSRATVYRHRPIPSDVSTPASDGSHP